MYFFFREIVGEIWKEKLRTFFVKSMKTVLTKFFSLLCCKTTYAHFTENSFSRETAKSPSWQTITDFTKKLMKSFYAHSILDFFCKIKVFSRKFWTEVKWFHDFILSRTEIALKIYYSWFHEILPLSHHYYSSKQLLWVRDTNLT